jgi:hypothetical protein
VFHINICCCWFLKVPEKLPRKGQTKVRRKKFHPKVQVERVPKERKTETPLKAKTPKTPRKAKTPHHEGNGRQRIFYVFLLLVC